MKKRFETQFQQFIQENNLFVQKNQLLVAVSGGIDSMTLAHLLYKWHYSISVVHCNFQLRGKESNDEERFVKKWAEQRKIPFYSRRFNTKQYAHDNKISVQESARKLRYDFFNEIAVQHKFDKIVVAHQRDDVVETFFINLFRGTGIKGLTGIPLTRRQIVRPLLFATREEILQYAKSEKIEWKEDSSNASDKYLRNQIRHHIIPALIKIEPDFYNIFNSSIEHIKDTFSLFEYWLLEKSADYIYHSKNEVRIKFMDIVKQPYGLTWLFYLLQPYHFNKEQVLQISKCHQSGKKFISIDYTAYIHGDNLIITEKTDNDNTSYVIQSKVQVITKPVSLQISIKRKVQTWTVPDDSNIGCFDAEKIIFPLKLRKWKAGDMFQPLGMKNFKKLSDFFIDLKLSIPEKTHTWILENGNGEIIWVVGYRIDQRYSISNKTKNILFIHKTE